MEATKEMPKQAKRELARWKTILALREAGLTPAELAARYDITTSQVYALLVRAKDAKQRGWL